MAVEIKNPELGTTTNTTPKVLVLNDVSGMPKAVDLFANTNPQFQHINLDNTVISSSVLAGGSTITLIPNKTNRYTGAQVNTFTVALDTPVANQINIYTLTYMTGATKPTINWPSSSVFGTATVYWNNNVSPTNTNMGVNKRYQVIFEVLDANVILASYGEY